VTLEGVLDSVTQREDVERAIAPLRGVRGVTNRIGVVPLHTQGVQVWLHDGAATVVGRVHSVEERVEVLAVVQEAVGSRTVEDQLVLSPPD
jgi:osmotically-inducible protein OsmY